ncbi:hypothetical protein [Autumnicola musiva]|uniref:Lipoprotein n=1 Tax=Autumnicola musiva TaxID=3075589 RepID=A0ABU3D528_9FLAO|nr:hypothetical protein [Zunongwangia sp. F117]MDT0676635.1 hypothetical protein [Zunongwangia sp. F117]
MKNRNFIFGVKDFILKCSFILLVLTLTSIQSCTSVQYGLDAQKTSKFSTFDDLGVSKEEFIKQYGPPTNKGLYQETPAEKIEKLYYTEKIKSFLVTTEFVFENNILKQMERVETKNNLQIKDRIQ